MQARFSSGAETAGTGIDWSDPRYPAAFLPYFFVQTTGPLSQSYMYWLISSFSVSAQDNVRKGGVFRSLEAVGQAVSYGMNTRLGDRGPLVGFCVTTGLAVAAAVPMIWLVGETPERIPAEVIMEEQEAEHAAGEKEAKVSELAV